MKCVQELLSNRRCWSIIIFLGLSWHELSCDHAGSVIYTIDFIVAWTILRAYKEVQYLHSRFIVSRRLFIVVFVHGRSMKL